MKKIIRVTTVSSTFRLLSGQMRFLSNHFDVVCVSSAGQHLNDLEKNEGVRTIAVDIKRSISPLNDIVTLIKLIQIFRREKPWMVHSISPKAGLLSMLAAYFAGVENRIHTFTGLLFPTATGLKRKILLTTDKLTCLFATHIIPEGSGVKKDLILHKVTNKELKILGYGNINGVNLEYFNKTDEVKEESQKIFHQLKFKNDDYIFVFVGRIVGDKGMNELVHAFNSINQIHHNAKLLIVGPIEEQNDPVSNETKKVLISNESIFHVGYQSDVRPYLALSNVFVFPSYREGVPNSLIQACAMDLPAIVTDINGCNEIVKHNFNGLIIPKKDTEALEKAMLRFLNDKDLEKKLSKSSRSFVEERYEQRFVWSKILDFYKKLEVK